MYDTVNFKLTKTYIPDVDLLDFVPQFLTKETSTIDTDFGTSINGYLDNFRVKITQNSVKIYNSSICKYYLGDNFQTMTRTDTQRAVEKISDTLHVPFEKATVTRIDVSTNLKMKYPEVVYYSQLGNLQYHTRSEMNNGLYYFTSTGSKTLLFYGKVYEQKTKGKSIPEIYKDKNLLRYELRFNKQLSKQFNRADITASMLYTEDFYIDIVDRWKNHYLNIDKLKLQYMKKELLINVKVFREYLYMDNLKSKFGNQIQAENLIKIYDKMGFFGNRTQKKRLRDEIKKAYNLPNLMYKSDVIEELDQKIIEFTDNK